MGVRLVRFLRKPMVAWITALALLGCLPGCASSPAHVTHSFTFDGWYDGWAKQADLLEFSYGDQERMVRRKSDDGSGLGYRFSVWSAMPVADHLYVKWRLKANGEVVEDRVELRGRLPSDMRDQKIAFVIDGRQLYVYLVTPKPPTQRLEKPPLRTWLSEFHLAYEIYPANQLKKTEA